MEANTELPQKNVLLTEASCRRRTYKLPLKWFLTVSENLFCSRDLPQTTDNQTEDVGLLSLTPLAAMVVLGPEALHLHVRARRITHSAYPCAARSFRVVHWSFARGSPRDPFCWPCNTSMRRGGPETGRAGPPAARAPTMSRHGCGGVADYCSRRMALGVFAAGGRYDGGGAWTDGQCRRRGWPHTIAETGRTSSVRH